MGILSVLQEAEADAPFTMELPIKTINTDGAYKRRSKMYLKVNRFFFWIGMAVPPLADPPLCWETPVRAALRFMSIILLLYFVFSYTNSS